MRKLCVVFLAVTLLVGCGGNDENATRIGVIMPLTGPVAEPGTNALQGIKTAVDIYNSQNDHKIELFVEDSQSSPRDGVSAMNKLLSANHVDVVIGDIMSSVFLAIAPIAEQNKIVLISPGASNPSVREAGKYVFRIYASDDYDGLVMANYIADKMSLAPVALVCVNNDYGVGVRKSFAAAYASRGGSIALDELYTEGQTDFRTIIGKVASSPAQVIYIAGNPTENGYLVKQMRELGLRLTITGNLSFENKDFLDIAKGAFDTITFSAPFFDLNAKSPDITAFVAKYNEEYNAEPDVAASLGHDVVGVLEEALRSVNFNCDKLDDALLNLHSYSGITGNISFDSKGDVIKDIYIKKINGEGQVQIVEKYTPNSNAPRSE